MITESLYCVRSFSVFIDCVCSWVSPDLRIRLDLNFLFILVVYIHCCNDVLLETELNEYLCEVIIKKKLFVRIKWYLSSRPCNFLPQTPSDVSNMKSRLLSRPQITPVFLFQIDWSKKERKAAESGAQGRVESWCERMWKCVALEDIKGPAPSARSKHSATLVGEHLYLLGGRNGNLPLKDFWKHHLSKSSEK